MRSCLLGNQDWEKIGNIILSGRHIGCRVGSDRKLSHRKCIVVAQYIFLDICLVFLLVLKILTSVRRGHAILEINLQIMVFQLIQKHTADMKFSVCPLKHRRGEHFANRNIDIGDTVFKD